MELTISQYSKYGPLDVWSISPIFKGKSRERVNLFNFNVRV